MWKESLVTKTSGTKKSTFFCRFYFSKSNLVLIIVFKRLTSIDKKMAAPPFIAEYLQKCNLDTTLPRTFANVLNQHLTVFYLSSLPQKKNFNQFVQVYGTVYKNTEIQSVYQPQNFINEKRSAHRPLGSGFTLEKNETQHSYRIIGCVEMITFQAALHFKLSLKMSLID